MTDLKERFISIFGTEPLITEAPGRINLIGEHTDYNAGFVLPAAINKIARFALALNKTKEFRFFASDLNKNYQTINIKPAPKEFSWANYLLGVLAQFKNEGVELQGVDCVFESNIPVGAGLSSSAAIECGFAMGLNQLYKTDFSKLRLVEMSQKAEHEYTGVMCGIMDQYACIFGRNNHVLRLDCRNIDHDYLPFNMSNLTIALCDTRVKHELSSSEYNHRRKECELGVTKLQQQNSSIKNLRDVDLTMMEDNEHHFDPLTFKRCQYVVEENQRVLDACDALTNKDFLRFGKLMYQSHDGLKNKFEVSCKELDLLVDMTNQLDYVYGSRMMGGGFGGCTINLLERNEEVQFHHIITEGYKAQTGIKPDIYFVELTDGAKVV